MNMPGMAKLSDSMDESLVESSYKDWVSSLEGLSKEK